MDEDSDCFSEFDRQAASIALVYAEWHKEAPCRNAVERALAEAYLKGRQDAAIPGQSCSECRIARNRILRPL